MTHPARRRPLRSVALMTLSLLTGVTGAQPADAPIRIVVGYPPGQTVDIIARNYAAALARDLGRSVYVENRAGANGIMGAQEVKRSRPDG
ncbi:tripartite tricarboxylate transporter substrate-binding protein, partial [Salmonella enterica]|nr:tripartite tricarboxylate transporter substrate-binding protein [Salmonella enterica]